MKTKKMMFHHPALLHALLGHLSEQLIHYASYQIQSGAQARTRCWTSLTDHSMWLLSS